MVKKKIVRRKPSEDSVVSDNHKRVNATKSVKELYDKNPDTSVYSKRYQYKKTTHTED